MPVSVSKFGGTSLANGERFLNVSDIVHAHPARRVVVVSAPGKSEAGDQKVTDLLSFAFENKDEKAFLRVRERFCEISSYLKCSIDEELLMAEEAVLHGSDRARALSMGEYLSAKLFSLLSGYHFTDAKDVIFFKDAKVDEDRTQSALINTFRRHKFLVIPGFYGADDRGRYVLFPRGGGDITGAVTAFFLGADEYENWTDVDGISDRDPNIYKDAKVLSHLNYDQAERILAAGAAVLHRDCIAWARRSGIKIRVRSTFHPLSLGTLITP